MPGTISSIPQACKGNNQGKLQAAQQKAGAAIQKLCESGEDSEAAAVLFARFEELKKRHDRLREFQESLPSITETPTEDAPTDNKDEAEPETSVPEQLQVVRHGDGAYECILSPDLKYPLPDDLNVEDSTQLAIGVARQFIHLAMQALAGCFDDLHDAQAIYLANIYDDLSGQKERMDSLQVKKASELAIEVAAQLYLADALRYLQSVELIVKSMASPDDGSGSE